MLGLFGTRACVQDTGLTELPPKLYAYRFWKIQVGQGKSMKTLLRVLKGRGGHID